MTGNLHVQHSHVAKWMNILLSRRLDSGKYGHIYLFGQRGREIRTWYAHAFASRGMDTGADDPGYLAT